MCFVGNIFRALIFGLFMILLNGSFYENGEKQSADLFVYIMLGYLFSVTNIYS